MVVIVIFFFGRYEFAPTTVVVRLATVVAMILVIITIGIHIITVHMFHML